jgi:hypothetical protein
MSRGGGGGGGVLSKGAAQKYICAVFQYKEIYAHNSLG